MAFIKWLNLIKQHSIVGSRSSNLDKIQWSDFCFVRCLCNKPIDEKIQSFLLDKNKKEEAVKEVSVEPPDEKVYERLRKGDALLPYNDPYERAKNIFIKDMKYTAKELLYKCTGIKSGNIEWEYFLRETDILIIGGGAVGIAVAHALRSDLPHGPNVIVIDKDDDFSQKSTTLGQGMLTQQLFTENEEILMSQYCAEFLSSFHRHTKVMGKQLFKMAYEPLGTLVLADENNAEKLVNRSEIMKKYKARTNLLDLELLKKKFPWLNLNDVLFGSIGMTNEGVFDPWLFIAALKLKAINLGVRFVKGEVVDIVTEERTPCRVICRLPDGTYNFINFAYCVLATGIETLKLVDIINSTDIGNIILKLPLEKRKRYEFCFYNPDGPGLNTPIVIESNGVYFRREGLTGHYIAGISSIPCTENEEHGMYHVLVNTIKPVLMKRVPDFEKYELVNCWYDIYDINSANNVGIIGPHPSDNRILFATGFKNSGLQNIPAIARALMEYIYYDEYKTIDFKPYEIENLYRRQHLEAEKRRQQLIESQKRTALIE